MLEYMQQYYLDEKNGAIPGFIAAALFLVLGSLLSLYVSSCHTI